MAEFNKVGLLVQNESGQFLMCKKDHFTSLLILPGGRIEDGETDMECLDRELAGRVGTGDAPERAVGGQLHGHCPQ